jgi:hypothetical protein
MGLIEIITEWFFDKPQSKHQSIIDELPLTKEEIWLEKHRKTLAAMVTDKNPYTLAALEGLVSPDITCESLERIAGIVQGQTGGMIKTSGLLQRLHNRGLPTGDEIEYVLITHAVQKHAKCDGNAFPTKHPVVNSWLEAAKNIRRLNI